MQKAASSPSPNKQQKTKLCKFSLLQKKKIHPVIFYRLAVITRITLPVCWKGTEKWHSTSHQCWQYFTAMMGTGNFPVACYLPVGGPVGKLSGRALQGTNRNRRSWPSCTSRHEISGVPVWREMWRNKVRCKGIPSGKVTSRSDTAASSPNLQECPEREPSFFQSLLECSTEKPLEVE